jgi:outer membrane lipoprotein SlyB
MQEPVMQEPVMAFGKFAIVAVGMALTAALGGCASGIGAGDYSRGQVGQINRVEEVVVVSVRPIRVEGESTWVGTGAGAAIGGIAGSKVGGGSDERTIGAVAGAVLGGAVGSAVEKGVTTQQGFEYVVRLANGDMRTIAQGGDVYLPPGSRAMIIYGARARIVPR